MLKKHLMNMIRCVHEVLFGNLIHVKLLTYWIYILTIADPVERS